MNNVGDVWLGIRACVLVFNRPTYDYFYGLCPISEWLKTLCEKVEAKSTQSRESQAVCQGSWLRLGDLVGVGPRNRELKRCVR